MPKQLHLCCSTSYFRSHLAHTLWKRSVMDDFMVRTKTVCNWFATLIMILLLFRISTQICSLFLLLMILGCSLIVLHQWNLCWHLWKCHLNCTHPSTAKYWQCCSSSLHWISAPMTTSAQKNLMTACHCSLVYVVSQAAMLMMLVVQHN